MCQPRKYLRRIVMAVGLTLTLLTTSGCGFTLASGFWDVGFNAAYFWGTTLPIPVTPYFSQLVEDTYWEEERYGKVPILDPVEGEHAPTFCLDPPSPDEVMRALPDDVGGGVPFLAETQRNNVRIVTELIVDRIDECRFFPLVGPAKLHHCHYKCTIYYDKVIRSMWPIPYSFEDATQEVVYIDHDHLIRCAGPPTPK